MQPHIQNYREYYRIGEQDIVLCEVCGAVAVDIHHIDYRSHIKDDSVANLIALCRACHTKAHAKIIPKQDLTKIKQDNINQT